MEVKKRKFEKDLKAKIQQKLRGKETEEVFLIKAFKFVDISGSGKVNFDQFLGAVAKMGFAMDKPVPSPIDRSRNCRDCLRGMTRMEISTSTTRSSRR